MVCCCNPYPPLPPTRSTVLPIGSYRYRGAHIEMYLDADYADKLYNVDIRYDFSKEEVIKKALSIFEGLNIKSPPPLREVTFLNDDFPDLGLVAVTNLFDYFLKHTAGYEKRTGNHSHPAIFCSMTTSYSYITRGENAKL